MPDNMIDEKEKDNVVDKSPVKDKDLDAQIDFRWNRVKDHYSPWIKMAKEDYRFALGKQWDKEDEEKLKNQARPVMVFNRIRPLINLVSGYQRENSARIKVNPEGGEDKIFSEVMDRGIKYIDKQSNLTFKMGYWFDDGCYCGKGFLEALLVYDKDPIRGEIKFRQRSPYQILPDPDNVEYDMNEGKYLFVLTRLTKDELKDLYPGNDKLIEGFAKDNDNWEDNASGVDMDADDDYGQRPERAQSIKITGPEPGGEGEDGKFTVKEYWYKKSVKRFFVINKESGEPVKFETKELADEFIVSQGFGKVIERKVPEIWVAARVCGFLLQNEKSPFEPHYSGYPFFRFMADWAPNAEDEEDRVQGITRPLKDPQREKNKSKSNYLHILGTQANSGWVGDNDALTPEGWKKLENLGSVPGITIRKKKGSELREILPKGPNQGHLLREEKADEEFKQISGINPDLMGFQEGTASGRAISMRIKQAILALVRLFQNYRYSKQIIGNFMLEMIPMVIDQNKFLKILGPDYLKKATDPEKYPDGLSAGNVAAFLTMVSDNKYDVIVTEADQNASIRFEIFQELTELVKAGAPIPITLLIDYMDLPNSGEVKKKIEEYQAQLAAAESAKGVPGTR